MELYLFALPSSVSSDLGTILFALLLVCFLMGLMGAGILIIRIINRFLPYNIRLYFSLPAGIVLIVLLGLTGFLIVSNPVEIDPTEPYAFSLANIRSPIDLSRAQELHNTLLNLNVTDPLGFLFEDSPVQSPSRIISVHANNSFTNVDYVVNISGSLKPTLLQVKFSYTNPESVETLKTYVNNYLNATAAIANRIKVDVLFRPSFLSETAAELMITFKDSDSNDAVILILGYNQGTGYTSSVNIVYAQDNYVDWLEDPSLDTKMYQERVYTRSEHYTSFIGILFILMVPGLIIGWVYLLIVKKSVIIGHKTYG